MSSQTTSSHQSSSDSNNSSSSKSSGPWWWTFGSVPELPARELDQLNQSSQYSLQIIDVRTETEYQNGHIEGSINCSFLPNIFSFSSRMNESILPKLDKNKPVYAICLSAHRSIAAVKWLTQQGYQAFQLKGGMQEWRKEQLHEVTTSTTSTVEAPNNKK